MRTSTGIFGAAHPLYFPVLQDMKQFDLQVQGHLADFIQKDGASVGQFKFAGFAPFARPVKAPPS